MARLSSHAPSNIATGQRSASTTSAVLVAARAGSVTYYNQGSVTVFIGPSGVTTAAGFPVPASSTLTLTFAGALYTALTASATAAFSDYEVF